MKKILLSLVVVMTMSFAGKAQSDNFITPGEDVFTRDDITWIIPILPGGGIGAVNDDQPATPLGSGLLILTALGAGYAIRKRKK